MSNKMFAIVAMKNYVEREDYENLVTSKIKVIKFMNYSPYQYSDV
jgi:hypothetical protein